MSPASIPAIAPCRFARFHHTPRTSGKKSPEHAKSNAQATAPRMLVSFRLATNAPAAPITMRSTRATTSRVFVSAFGSMIL